MLNLELLGLELVFEDDLLLFLSVTVALQQLHQSRKVDNFVVVRANFVSKLTQKLRLLLKLGGKIAQSFELPFKKYSVRILVFFSGVLWD